MDRPNPAGRRASARFDACTVTDLSAGDCALAGEIRNISRGGAFVAVETPAAIATGEGVRLHFHLSCGTDFRVCGRVKWVREQASDQGPAGYGVEFYGLGKAEQEVIEQFAETRAEGQTESATSAKVFKKYAVECKSPGWLWIWINGFLEPAESRELGALVQDQLTRVHNDKLLAYVDVSRFSPCPEDSLDDFRQWIEALGRSRLHLGVLVGRSSVGLLQVRRLAREAGIADLLVCFEEEREAVAFLHEALH